MAAKFIVLHIYITYFYKVLNVAVQN